MQKQTEKLKPLIHAKFMRARTAYGMDNEWGGGGDDSFGPQKCLSKMVV